MKRSKTISLSSVKGFFIYIALSLILSFLSLSYPLLLIPLAFFLIILLKKNSSLFRFSIIISFLGIVIFLISKYMFDEYSFSGLIKGIVTEKYDNYILLKSGFNYIKVYTDKEVLIGDKLELIVKSITTEEKNLEGIFSYYKYKLSKRIIEESSLKEIVSIDRTFNIYTLKRIIIDYINSFSTESKEYIMKLLLGYSSLSENVSESINDLGILYLYSVSGLHINLIDKYLRKLLNFLNISNEITSIITSLFFIFFFYISSNSSSIRRAVFTILINNLFLLSKLKYTKEDVLSISFILQLFINPFSIYDTGFYLTYLSTGIIYLSKEKNDIKTTLIINLFTIPFILYKNSKISIFVILFSILFNTLFSSFIIPLTYLVFLVKYLDPIYKIITEVLNKILLELNEINLFIYFSIESVYSLVLIYIFLFMLMKYKKTYKFKKVLISFLMYLPLLIFFSYFSLFPKVTFLDVNQGDSILIEYGFKNFLVDTGNEDKYHSLYNYLLKTNNINLDYLFISHHDSDHSGESEYLKKNLHVKNVIDFKNNYEIDTGPIHIKTIYKSFSSENDSSMVLYINIYNRTILLTGDIEEKGEDNVLEEGVSNIDILKVSHHGSSTSSSSTFISQIKPLISIISVGKNNYGHPSKDVLERLKSINSRVLRTDIDGTITIKFYFNVMYIKNYLNEELELLSIVDNKRIIFS